MTAKRFMVDDCGTLIDMTNRNTYDYVSDVCDLSNELAEENEQLQSRINDYDVALKRLQDLCERKLKENEQLKSEYKVLHTQYQDLKKFIENNFDEYLTQEKLNRQIIKLSDENEQLKKALWCIRKRYGYTVEEFIEDLKDNGIDLTKVDLE